MNDFAACNCAVECTLAANSSTSLSGFARSCSTCYHSLGALSISSAVVDDVFFFTACELFFLDYACLG